MKLKELLETDLKDLKMNPIDLRFLLEDLGLDFRFFDPSNNLDSSTYGVNLDDDAPISGGYGKGFYPAGHWDDLSDPKSEDYHVMYKLSVDLDGNGIIDKISYYPNQYKITLYIIIKVLETEDEIHKEMLLSNDKKDRKYISLIYWEQTDYLPDNIKKMIGSDDNPYLIPREEVTNLSEEETEIILNRFDEKFNKLYTDKHTYNNVISLLIDLRKYYPIDLNLSGAVKSMNESIKSFKRFTTK